MSDVVDVRLRIRELADVREQRAAAALLARVWHAEEAHPPVEPVLIRALEHSGNYVAGAFAGDEMVGAAAGFTAPGGHLHSHITGVLPAHRGLHVGYALKQHQRDWALARGIGEIHWTFDPLLGRNAYFNLHKLGALPTAYLPDFYGPMLDGVNAGHASDRLYLVWRLDSPRRAEPGPADTATLLGADQDGAPVLRPTGAARVLIRVPDDIEALRRASPAAAAGWRLAVRQAMQQALASGYRITGFRRDGHYVLENG
ncbi:GNAT family N-acetyltransferase [Nonomuraea sp. NPDC050536]|uniref:GNAT family N-acetyltransferase n=1 Tax=Nonomuraea sp. NPDC050536 TaxID=3364366 RepID=UPI0037C782B5